MATVEELQAELAKRDEQIRGLSTKLQAHERVVRELGDAVERDAYGNPVRLVVEDNAPPVGPGTVVGAHPLSFVSAYAGEGWTPEAVDAYYLQLIGQKGYLTKADAEKLAEAKAQAYANLVMGNARVWRNYDKLTAQETYKDLGNKESELAKRTARILQERQYGAPMTQTWHGFDEWQYRDLGDLQFAADLARLELSKEADAEAASKAQAAAAQAAGNLSPTPQAGAGTGTPVSGKPDFSTLSSPEEIVGALDAALASSEGGART